MKKILSLIIVVCVVLAGCSPRETVTTNIDEYYSDCEMLKNASTYMPKLTDLGEYLDLKYTYQVTCYSNFMGFYSDTMALFVKYDSETYAEEKERVLGSYKFLEEPVMRSSDTYELPVTEFDYNGYRMKVVPDEDYIDFCACKSFMILGFNDDACTIAYLYYYDFDLDYIAEADEDLEAEMRGLVDVAFSWPEF